MTKQLYNVVFIHAPSVYDFRERDDILFAYLSNSDSVHVSPIFEMPPVGMIAIQHHLKRLGFKTAFFNIASYMLKNPEFDVGRFFERIKSEVVGFDLHWTAHAHGSLELAALYKSIHPKSRIVMGGLSATFFHAELIEYEQVDYVIRGYDTLFSVEELAKSNQKSEKLAEVPNLTWKDDDGVHVNPATNMPDLYTAAVDWGEIFRPGESQRTQYSVVIPQAGCEYNCRFCGGSRYFYSSYMGGKTVVPKSRSLLSRELERIVESADKAHTVTMINFWHEYTKTYETVERRFLSPKIDCVHISLHRLPEIEKGRRMAKSVRTVLELSPDSSCPEIAKETGRDKYSMAEMETFIDSLIDDVYMFEIYFMIGLPGQSEIHVREDLAYCEHLLRKYKGRRIVPYICPMLPFLDPGSEIYDSPEKFGYTLFHRSLEDHRRALTSLNWTDRLNYATQWMSREQLVCVSNAAVRELTMLKAKYRLLPSGIAEGIVSLIDETTDLLRETGLYRSVQLAVHESPIPSYLREKIRTYNQKIFTSVRSQQRPIDFGFSRQQWFDTDDVIVQVMNGD